MRIVFDFNPLAPSQTPQEVWEKAAARAGELEVEGPGAVLDAHRLEALRGLLADLAGEIGLPDATGKPV